ncbi:ABC transporter ATP-binding protein [Halosimplex halophilum]|uniref:ABC transporter ATP-binding protein n=1 Tax=Halosimplex halophilum TaxID=2559572 RepID=UPI00107F7324|nr:ABC transporter ATP-binding protein [Halosimplex halophilum]
MTERDRATAPAIEAETVSKRYDATDGGATTALADVSFAVDPGEFVTVVGPSGCGKTTLVRLVGGLETPTDGRILVDGEPVVAPGPDRAMVFQEYRLFPWLSVRENVAFGLVEAGVPAPRRTDRVREMLELVGLDDRAEAYPSELSGGMKQRVGLARALAVDPGMLLLDEPFGSVDAQTRRHLGAELLSIWRELDKTVLFVTHDIEEAVTLADRVLVLSGTPGRVRADVRIDLPRPRDRTDDEFVDCVDRLLDLVESTR